MTNTPRISTSGRHLTVIDIENLAATPNPRREAVRTISTALRDAVPGYDDAQRIVACSHHAAPTVAFEFPAARHLWRSGRNGADLAILDVLKTERVGERFDRVTICSGDGIFAESAARLASAGIEVTVVSLPDQLAVRLELAARTVTLLAATSRNMATGSAS